MVSLSPASNPPYCLTHLARISPIPPWKNDLVVSCKPKIKAVLLINQNYQCIYCERPLSEDRSDSTIEHIEAQSVNPMRRFDISNLAACCDQKGECEHSKGDSTLPATLHPYTELDLHSTLYCNSEGELEIESLSQEDFGYVQDTLKLNNEGLKSQRRELITAIMTQIPPHITDNAKKMRAYDTSEIGFRSIHYQYLGQYGFPKP